MKDVVEEINKRVELELNYFREALIESFHELINNNANTIRDPTNNKIPKKHLNQKLKQLKRKDLSIEQQSAITGYYDYLEKVLEKELSNLVNPDPKEKGKGPTMKYDIKKVR